MIYLLKQEARHGVYYKIGFASNLEKRFRQYSPHNAEVYCLESIVTYGKTKRQLERALHAELKKKGYKFDKAKINGSQTEFFFVPYGEEADRFEAKGLAQFKACKGRKIIKHGEAL